MITIQGKGVSKGVAKGPLYFFQRSDTTVTVSYTHLTLPTKYTV